MVIFYSYVKKPEGNFFLKPKKILRILLIQSNLKDGEKPCDGK